MNTEILATQEAVTSKAVIKQIEEILGSNMPDFAKLVQIGELVKPEVIHHLEIPGVWLS